MNFIFSTVGLVGVRLSFRLARERFHSGWAPGSRSRRLAIYGAGSSGAALLEELLARPNLRMQVCAMFDDDERKRDTRIHGVPILGRLSRLRKEAKPLRLDEVILSMPTADPCRTRAVVAQCRRLNLPVRTIPTIHHVVNGHLRLGRIKPVEFEDLLARESVEMESPRLGSLCEGSSCRSQAPQFRCP